LTRSPFVTGLVLAAGASSRLGRPKQLLPYGDGTLLEFVLGIARRCPFDQLICVIGGDLAGVDFAGVEVVENPRVGEGCSSSIGAALGAVDPRADLLVLMLGDQPGVTPGAVRALVSRAFDGFSVAACRYDDGRGHPLAFGRDVFDQLAGLRGDKAVWKLLDRLPVLDVPVPGPVPRDVDTWEDYAAVLEGHNLSAAGFREQGGEAQ
jgi:molybdenum cofactor cytidylyltransferase